MNQLLELAYLYDMFKLKKKKSDYEYEFNDVSCQKEKIKS